MKNIISYWNLGMATFGGVLGFLLGGLDGFLYTLIVFVIADYITGVMVAIVQHKLSSEIGFKGIFKKVMLFVIIAIGNLVDINLLGNNGVLRTAIVFFYISNEGISLIENASNLGLPIPKQLKIVLEQLSKENEEDNSSDNK